MTSTDLIEKNVVLNAPLERVWAAITNAQKFGNWFGLAFDGDFVAGTRITGRIVPTTVDAEVAKVQAPHAGLAFELHIERIEPMSLFSYRWHPFAIDPDADYSNEPMTLVVFALEPVADGTRLTITESGFDAIPLGRRVDAFEANDEGWSAQLGLIEKYLAQTGA